jgi:hypothetical protein
MSSTTAPPRNSLRTTLLVAGSIVIVLLVGYLVVVAVAAANRPDASREIVIDESFDAIEVTAEVTDVVVKYGAVDAPTVTFAQNGERRDMSFDAAVSGSTLDVSVIDHGRGWWLPFEFNDSPRVTIIVPESYGAVDLTTDSDVGDITLIGDFADIELTATTGDVRLRGSAETAELETTVGDLTAEQFGVTGELTVRANTGDIVLDLEVIPAQLDVTSDVGDQTVTVPEGAYRVETETNVGDVDVSVENDEDADTVLRFETTVGDITVRN